MRTRIRIALVTLAALAALARPGQAQNFLVEQRDSLRGLPGLHVLIGELSPGTETDGLRRSDIQADLELQLRHAGIPVMSIAQAVAHPASPGVWIRLEAVKREDGVYAVYVHVVVNQKVQLASGGYVLAPTWEDGTMLTVDRAKLRQVRDVVKDVVNKLIKDWSAVNSKK
jgi:hypothetical protein